MGQHKEGDLKIWHISNPPRGPFQRDVGSVDEARDWLRLLADYDLYLGDVIDCNAQGLEIYEDGEWCEWVDDDGYDISELMRMED